MTTNVPTTGCGLIYTTLRLRPDDMVEILGPFEPRSEVIWRPERDPSTGELNRFAEYRGQGFSIAIGPADWRAVQVEFADSDEFDDRDRRTRHTISRRLRTVKPASMICCLWSASDPDVQWGGWDTPLDRLDYTGWKIICQLADRMRAAGARAVIDDCTDGGTYSWRRGQWRRERRGEQW